MRDPGVLEDVDRARYHTITGATGQFTGSGLGTSACGQPGSPSCHPAWCVYEHTQTHDASGNVDATWGKETRGGGLSPKSCRRRPAAGTRPTTS